MTLPISNSPPPESRAPEARAPENRPGETQLQQSGQPLGTPNFADVSSLSIVAGRSIEPDSSRIESLRRQFQQGTYQVDATKVSQKILDLQFPTPD